jgi:hypothetical protein
MNKYFGVTVFEKVEKVNILYLIEKTRYTCNTESVRACVFTAMSARYDVIGSYEVLGTIIPT